MTPRAAVEPFAAWPFPRSHRITLGAALLAAMILVAYLPAIRGGYVWDDNLLVAQNPLIAGSTNPLAIWGSHASLDYTPLTLTMFWVEWRLFAGNPAGFHLVNLALHGLAAVLVWRTLERLEIPGGWIAALLFAIHPVNAASVAWIAELKNTLSLVFYLLALRWFLDFQSIRKPRFYVFALLAAGCAFLSKGSTVILPATMLWCTWWRRRRWTWADAIEIAPFFVLAAIFARVTVMFQAKMVTKGLAEASPAYRIVRAGEAVWFYVWKDLLPLGLCPFYPKWPIRPESPLAYLPAILAVGLVVLFWWNRKGWGRPFLFAWGYFLLGLAPVLGFMNMGFMDQVHVADWWQELAMIGLTALAGAGIAIAWRRLRKGWRAALALAAGVAVALLCGQTWSEASTYRSAETFWGNALAHNPESWESYDNYGNALSMEGRLDEAIALYRKGILISKDHATIFYNLANTLRREGKPAEAIPNYQSALQLNPAYKEAHNNLGVALKTAGRLDDAIAQYHDALQIDPGYSEAHDNLGVALQAQGHLDAAIAEYQEAARLEPDNQAAIQNLKNARSEQGPLEAAMAGARQVLQQHGYDAETYAAIAGELEQRGLYSNAVEIFQEALGKHPRDPRLLADFAWLLATCPDASVRNGAAAMKLASEATEISGKGDAAILNPMAVAYAAVGRFPEAITTGEEALGLAEKTSDQDLAGVIEQELASFSKGEAFTYK